MNYPKEFKIAGQIIQVVFEDLGDVFGRFDSVRNKITIYRKVYQESEYVAVSESQIRSTFYHELVHVFNYFYNTETDEALAQVFSNFICEFEDTKIY